MELMEPDYFEKERYERAKKRVKRIRGFHIHLMVYIVVNLMNLGMNLSLSSEIFRWENFFSVFLWGIGLLAHALSVFGPPLVFGKNWEERKIKELMDREKQNKWE